MEINMENSSTSTSMLWSLMDPTALPPSFFLELGFGMLMVMETEKQTAIVAVPTCYRLNQS